MHAGSCNISQCLFSQHTLLFLFSLAIMVANFSLLQARAQSASNMRSRHPAVSQKPRESASLNLGRQMALCSTLHASRTSFSSKASSLHAPQHATSLYSYIVSLYCTPSHVGWKDLAAVMCSCMSMRVCEILPDVHQLLSDAAS